MSRRVAWLLLGGLLVIGARGAAAETSGSVDAGVDFQPQKQMFTDQQPRGAALTAAATIKVQKSLSRRVKVEVKGFARVHDGAEKQVSGDVREAYIAYAPGAWEVRAGVLNVHWGVLEAQNPLDIVNQRDLVEDFKGQTKLGQPGIELKRSFGNGQLSVALLPYFRERRLADGADRFRVAPLPISERGSFESSRGHWHPDLAGEFKWYSGSLDVALSQFWGTSREPVFRVEVDRAGRPSLRPHYDLISETGLVSQWISGDTIWKLELGRQDHPGGDFYDAGLGVERAIPKFFGTRWSATLYGEYYHSTRGDADPITFWDHDLFLGLRLAANDFNQTELELQSVFDVRSRASLLTFKARTSPGGGNWFLGLEADFFLNARDDRALSSFRRDARIRATVSRYF